MKKLTFGFRVLSLGLLVLAISSCEKENESLFSSHGSTASHNMGMNCMNCHHPGGEGEGVFNIAGSVYDSLQINSYPNTTIRLFSGPDGTGNLVITVEGDQKGNFYSTQAIDFGNGLYPAVEGGLISIFMPASITTGACNGCHGITNPKIWVK